MRTKRLSCFAASLLAAATSYAECNLPPDRRQFMDSLAGTPGVVQYSRGIEYYDFGCLAEAETALKAAVDLLTGAQATTQRDKDLVSLTVDALVLTRGVQLARTGEKSAAITEIAKVVDRADSLVKLRAIEALVPLLDDRSPHWPLVQREIDVLARRGFWQAEKVMLRARIASGSAAQAAAELEERLDAAGTVHDTFAAAILLADAWRAAGRTLEAWLLIRSIEDEAGSDLAEFALRIEFIRVAAAVAGARAAAGDEDAKRAQSVYEAALREVQPR